MTSDLRSATASGLIETLDALFRETTPGEWETRFWTNNGGKTIAVPSGYLIPNENCLSTADLCFIVEMRRNWPEIRDRLKDALARSERTVVTDAMVNRFLTWKLPESVLPDPCVMDRTYPHRVGTNILTFDEAKQMLEHVLSCPHGTVGYCEPCALRDPGEYGEQPPKLVHSRVDKYREEYRTMADAAMSGRDPVKALADKLNERVTNTRNDWLPLLEMFSDKHVVLHGAAGEAAMDVGDIIKIIEELERFKEMYAKEAHAKMVLMEAGTRSSTSNIELGDCAQYIPRGWTVEETIANDRKIIGNLAREIEGMRSAIAQPTKAEG